MKVGEEEEEEEMSSDCSSGCQSGWTTYLEQSSEFCKTVVDEKGGSYEHEEEEEEDLSMVSDASSGPPQLRLEDENHSRCCRKSNIGSWDTGCHGSAFAPPAAMAKDGFKKRRIGDPSSALTSFNKEDNFMKPFTEHVLDFPCSFSYVHVEEKSALQNPMNCLQSFTLFKPTPVRPMSSKGGKKIW
ncbi:protein SOB FIVE-LIKE 5-like isoform X4 [Musa acuminata AAA Group]|uniref:protein SOB FIVE-LIKE 5-like isoform X4 n=1 Tax=Musa acuminata AAA Group TaxID=214697 RepID=UPI0031DAAE5A